ncbi:hypothetical protein [Microcoleus sp. N9_B4]|uniref:hypothetical protein n=1 Tax=Microcoleus sp. N9_B4 TaxID=3055386 RepID=UPI002FD6054A
MSTLASITATRKNSRSGDFRQVGSQRGVYILNLHFEPLAPPLHRLTPVALTGVADLGYESRNMQLIETSIHKTSGFSSYFFPTMIK